MKPATPTDGPILVRVVRHWRTILEVMATLMVILVCVNLMWAMSRAPRPTSVPPLRPAARPAPPVAKLPTEPISLEGAATAGSSSAKAAVIEYSDYQCPFCARFARDTEPALRKEYVETGKVLFAFRHLPLEQIHAFALKAAESAECARRQDKFWSMHALLFEDPKALELPMLRQRAIRSGLDVKAFDRCLAGQALDRVREDAASAQALGITGTPAFLLGEVLPDGRVKVTRRLSGALPIEQFRAALDALLANLQGTK
jgi:protein-disulfide isomerase